MPAKESTQATDLELEQKSKDESVPMFRYEIAMTAPDGRSVDIRSGGPRSFTEMVEHLEMVYGDSTARYGVPDEPEEEPEK